MRKAGLHRSHTTNDWQAYWPVDPSPPTRPPVGANANAAQAQDSSCRLRAADLVCLKNILHQIWDVKLDLSSKSIEIWSRSVPALKTTPTEPQSIVYPLMHMPNNLSARSCSLTEVNRRWVPAWREEEEEEGGGGKAGGSKVNLHRLGRSSVETKRWSAKKKQKHPSTQNDFTVDYFNDTSIAQDDSPHPLHPK